MFGTRISPLSRMVSELSTKEIHTSLDVILTRSWTFTPSSLQSSSWMMTAGSEESRSYDLTFSFICIPT